MEYIEIGKIVNTHGLKGELKIESWSDFDDVRYEKGNTVYITNDEEYIPLKVASYRTHKGYALVSFEGLQDINLVEKYKDYIVCIEPDGRQELDDGEYYMDELIGLFVQDEDGRHIGVVTAVEETNGAQNNLRVARENNSDALIPFIPFFIVDVDLEVKCITIHVEKGLL